jgi:hypothetical protein
MMKFKQSIIYTLIFVLLSASLGFDKVAFADDRIVEEGSETSNINPAIMELSRQNYLQTQEQEVPEPSTLNYEKINAAIVSPSGSEGENFHESAQARAGIKEEAEEPPMTNTDASKEKWFLTFFKNKRDTITSIFQSFVSSQVLLGIASANKTAHDKNLILTPENERKLNEQLGDPATKWVYWPTNLLTIASAAGVNYGLTEFWKGFKKTMLRSEGTIILFRYLVSGALMSIGRQYIQGFILAASQEVLDHPELFGGLTPEQRGALRLLQYRADMAYFITTLSSDGSLTENADLSHRRQVFHEVGWKVEMAMNLILMHDSDLRQALWSHLWSQAFLQGNNGVILATSWISEKFVLNLAQADSYWKKNWKTLWLSIATGFAFSLIPNVAKDWGTAQLNSGDAERESLEQRTSLWWKFTRPEAARIEGRKKIVENYLQSEAENRKARFIKYAYIMKLSLDNLNTFEIEKAQIAKLKTPGGQAMLPQVNNWKDQLGKLYNQVIGFDFLPESWRAWLDGEYVDAYKVILRKAAGRALSIYKDDAQTMVRLEALDLPTETKAHVQNEFRKVQDMELYIDQLTKILKARWDTNVLSPNFEPARQKLEQLSFWGIDENSIITSLSEAH